MDEDKLIEKAGARPLLDLLRDLGWGVNVSEWGAGGEGSGLGWDLPGGWNLNKHVEDMHLLSIGVFFGIYVAEDPKNSSGNILQVSNFEDGDVGSVMFFNIYVAVDPKNSSGNILQASNFFYS